MTWRVDVGDCREVLASMLAGSVHAVVTSPPYFGLRDYGTGEWEGGDPACEHRNGNARTDHSGGGAGLLGTRGEQASAAAASTPMRGACSRCGASRVDRQVGLEATPDEYVAALVAVFREVRRVLRDDGTVWLNLGDSYADRANCRSDGASFRADRADVVPGKRNTLGDGVKQKDLHGIPWMVAFALRADGWYLRSDVVWAKPNPMPESVTDRPTKAHEYLFLLSKGPRYFYDADAIRETERPGSAARYGYVAEDGRINKGGAYREAFDGTDDHGLRGRAHTGMPTPPTDGRRNRRTVWTVATQPYAGAHFATFPPRLVEPCVLASAPRRACGECGAPWVRVVERTAMVVEPSPKRRAAVDGDAAHHRTAVGGTVVEAPTSRTVGWEATCGHGDGSAAGVVLDPFAGSGAVGVVCCWHGRDFVGVELNAEYAEMARTRVAVEGERGRRLGRPAERPDQLDFFGAPASADGGRHPSTEVEDTCPTK